MLSTHLHIIAAHFVALTRQPEWVVYHELVATTKEYMREVTAVEPQWFTEFAPNFFRMGDPTKLSKVTLGVLSVCSSCAWLCVCGFPLCVSRKSFLACGSWKCAGRVRSSVAFFWSLLAVFAHASQG